MVLPAPTRKARFYYQISPAALVTIVMLNFFLVYLNLSSLERQNEILFRLDQNIGVGLNITKQNNELIHLATDTLYQQGLIINETARNTNISLSNQALGLNITAQNQEMLQRVISVQERGNETFYKLFDLIEEGNQSSSANAN